MQTGKLRHLVTFQYQSVNRNLYGEEIVTWVNLGVDWGEIRPSMASERLVSGADQVQAIVDHSVYLRYRGDVTVKMRIAYAGRIFDIEGIVDPDGRRRRLRLDCREVLHG